MLNSCAENGSHYDEKTASEIATLSTIFPNRFPWSLPFLQSHITDSFEKTQHLSIQVSMVTALSSTAEQGSLVTTITTEQ